MLDPANENDSHLESHLRSYYNAIKEATETVTSTLTEKEALQIIMAVLTGLIASSVCMIVRDEYQEKFLEHSFERIKNNLPLFRENLRKQEELEKE